MYFLSGTYLLITAKNAIKYLSEKLKLPKEQSLSKKFLYLPKVFFQYSLKVLNWLLFRLFLVGCFVFCFLVLYFYLIIPEISELLDGRDKGSVEIRDLNGINFASRGRQFSNDLTPQNIPKLIHDSIIAVEDKRFYSHLGISPRGILSAIRINLEEGRSPFKGHGGSTITQQVSKLICLGKTEIKNDLECRRQTLGRKIIEIPFSFALELKFTKKEILSIYVNRVYLGGGANGFEAAAYRYFRKKSHNLNLSEAAMLSGLLTAPSKFSPVNRIDLARERGSIVLRLMREQGYISESEYLDANSRPAKLHPQAQKKIGEDFANWIIRNAPDSLSNDTTEDIVINTTFDPKIQIVVEKAYKNILSDRLKADSKAQIAIVVMEKNGAVRAIVGGRELKESKNYFNRATQAKRQPGSAFKPFVYATALDLGYSPFSIANDRRLSVKVPGFKEYSPKNYNDKYIGSTTLINALSNSINTIAVELGNSIGYGRIKDTAKNFGIGSEISLNPSMSLGTSEVSLIELTSAYAGILNKGISIKPFGLKELSLKGDGFTIIEHKAYLGNRVISEGASEALIYMLSQVIEKGTGVRAKIKDWGLAGKTGTTQNARDAWFLGFSSEYVVGVWMGKDDNTPLEGVTGGTLPAEIWRSIMLNLKPFHSKESQEMSLSVIVNADEIKKGLEEMPKNSNLKDYGNESFFERVIKSFSN